MSRRLPDFLFLGPDKSGSSWLFEVLRQHPDCFVPACKDVYYFDDQYTKGLDWYASFFDDAPEQAIAVGELSHAYLFSAEVAERIRQDLPGVRLMTSLRHPVDRCYSHYLYLVSSGLVTTSFAETIANRPGLTRSSYYAKPLGEYMKRFGPDQLKVLFFDDLQRDPRAYAAQVYDFLGLRFNEAFEYEKKVRPARQPRNFWLARLAKHGALAARKFGLVRAVGAVKHSFVARMLYKPYKKEEIPAMDPAVRTQLIQLFTPDILELQDMLKVDLSHWRV
jgi:hypothetical protein